MDGVSTYLALTFSTLLSSQGTDASFGFPSGAPPGFSLRCFVLAFPTLSDSFVSDSPSEGVLLLSSRPFRSTVPTSETLADSGAPTLIGAPVLSNADSFFHTQRKAHAEQRDEMSSARDGSCGVAARGPTWIGAHVEQPGVRYGSVFALSTPG